MLTHLPPRNFVKDDIIMEFAASHEMSLAVKYAQGPKPDTCWLPLLTFGEVHQAENQVMITLSQSPCRHGPACFCLEMLAARLVAA
jgi:hypothetical protein